MRVTRRVAFLIAIILCFIPFLASCTNEADAGVREVNAEAVFANDGDGDLIIHFFHLLPPDRFEKTGESILIQTPKGQTILVDAGKPIVGPLLDEYLTELNIEKIDYVMPSHPHSDHIGGFLTLFETKEIGKIIDVNLPLDESNVYNDYKKLIDEKDFTVEYAEEGDVYEIEKDLTIEVLNPPKGTSPETYAFANLTAGIVNDISMVFKLTYKENTFLFTGDIYSGVENSLIKKYGEELDVDVVVAPHHGLGTSSSKKFIETTNPQITFIPTNVLFDLTVIENYEAQGSEVYVSKFDGNIKLVSNGKQIDVISETESERVVDSEDDIDDEE